MGKELLNQVIKLTDLPPTIVNQELKRILKEKGIKEENVTLASLREALADYLKEVFADEIEDPETASSFHWNWRFDEKWTWAW